MTQETLEIILQRINQPIQKQESEQKELKEQTEEVNKGSIAVQEKEAEIVIEEQMISSEEGDAEGEMADMEPVELQVVNKKAERKQGIKADMSVRYKQLLEQDTEV